MKRELYLMTLDIDKISILHSYCDSKDIRLIVIVPESSEGPMLNQKYRNYLNNRMIPYNVNPHQTIARVKEGELLIVDAQKIVVGHEDFLEKDYGVFLKKSLVKLRSGVRVAFAMEKDNMAEAARQFGLWDAVKDNHHLNFEVMIYSKTDELLEKI